MKSQANELLSVARNILKDVALAYPTMTGLDRDYSRLARLVEHRGIGVFTLDLPAFDDMLLAGLESGRLNVTKGIAYSKRKRVPRLFSGLYFRVFDDNGCLKDDADPTCIFFLRQLYCLGKKLEVPCSYLREQKAIEEYIDVESTLRPPTLSWDSDALDTAGIGDSLCLHDHLAHDLPLSSTGGENGRAVLLLRRCQRIADIIAEELGNYDPASYSDERVRSGRGIGLRHGPGAVALQPGRYFDKYDFLTWSRKLENLFPYEEYGKMPSDNRNKTIIREEPSSRLISVPKTAKGPRLIAAEPAEHQWCQQLTLQWLVDRVENTFLGRFINFRKQQLSSRMVLKASLDKRLATIDLSSASDRLTCWVIERMFRKNPSLLRALHAHRTRTIIIPQKEMVIKLNKFASQGTAVTFPIQTICFLVIALAASMNEWPTRESLKRLSGRVRVYGDDIIIPAYGYADAVTLLHTLQLKVNENKSFVTGNFRESCGTDAFKGYDVTPVKVKRLPSDSPASCQATIDNANLFFMKGLWITAKYLEQRQSQVGRYKPICVGRDAGAIGYRSFTNQIDDNVLTDPRALLERVKTLYGNLKIRYNKALCRFEVLIVSVRNSSTVKPYDNGYSGLMDCASRVVPISIFSEYSDRGINQRSSLKVKRRWEPLLNLLG